MPRPALLAVGTVVGALALDLAPSPGYPPVTPGAGIGRGGRTRPPQPADDYGAYLERIGAVGTLRADSLALAPADRARTGSLAASLEALRRTASDGLSRAIPE